MRAEAERSLISWQTTEWKSLTAAWQCKNMHAPFEVTSKADIYEAFKGYLAFLEEMDERNFKTVIFFKRAAEEIKPLLFCNNLTVYSDT